MGVVVGASVVVTTQEGGVHTELLSSPVSPNTCINHMEQSVRAAFLLVVSMTNQIYEFFRWQAQ
jgi:hypothetical protein